MLSPRILIVGGRIAGLALATALRRRALNGELAERAARTPSLRLSSQRRQVSWGERFIVGRIAGLQFFSVPQFGTRACFRLECPGPDFVPCCVAGDVARELVASCFEGNLIAVNGDYEPRPSTASPMTPWSPRFCVHVLRSGKPSGLPPERQTGVPMTDRSGSP